MCSAAFLWKLLAFALGQAGPEGLHGSPNVVNELRTRADQRLTRADDGQMSLALFTPVFEWVDSYLAPIDSHIDTITSQQGASLLNLHQ
jgi:hypothetical protein